jgi:hypothetical protein
MIVDAPESVGSFALAQTWISSRASPLRTSYCGLYFPRINERDPLIGGVVRTFPAAGAIAVCTHEPMVNEAFGRHRPEQAQCSSVRQGFHTSSRRGNGTLNPLALNALRTFPAIGNVIWGARTARGADVFADDYKYIPVRRLALYVEESLYRGTQWVVFEPNDVPLWAQIRLNVGAFMHELYAQGAFEGTSPRQAYFVKCDSETTTQNDINLGRVNIVVGFAPLKPAEFVIIQIQQIAGAIQT